MNRKYKKFVGEEPLSQGENQNKQFPIIKAGKRTPTFLPYGKCNFLMNPYVRLMVVCYNVIIF